MLLDKIKKTKNRFRAYPTHQVVQTSGSTAVLSVLRDLCGQKRIKIYLAIKWLSENPNVRPGEMINIRERQILVDQKLIVVREVKERRLSSAKTVLLEDEDIEILGSLPTGMPDLHFFRHNHISGVTAGRPYGVAYLGRWWKRACEKIGLEGVSLYPGTKHSTVTALGQLLTPEEIKRGGTGHATNAAFERYMLPDQREKLKVREALKRVRLNAGQQLVNQNGPVQVLKYPK